MYKYKLIYRDGEIINFESQYYIAYLSTFFMNDKVYIHFPDVDVFINLTKPPIVRIDDKPYNLPVYKIPSFDD